MLMYGISVLVALALAFLCGSIPVALFIGRVMRGIDVRDHGSGNAGTANSIRVLGVGPGLLVFAADVLKAALGCVIVALATGISIMVASSIATQEAIELIQGGSEILTFDPIISVLASDQSSFLYDLPRALGVIATILGHMFSPFMGFKGGKGVATALGSLLVVIPFAALSALAVFAVILAISRYVSLSAIIAVITVPIFSVLLYPTPTYIVFTVLVALVVIWAHRKNIKRLRKGEEPKFSPSKKGSL